MIDRQPLRAAELARECAFTWLSSDMQELLSRNQANEFNILISDALLSFGGPKSLSKPIRNLVPTLSAKQAVEVAIYAFSWAMNAAALERTISVGLKLKRAITSPGCCDVCQTNKDQGAIPVGEPFQSGHMHAPFCAKCRCATTGVRQPTV